MKVRCINAKDNSLLDECELKEGEVYEVKESDNPLDTPMFEIVSGELSGFDYRQDRFSPPLQTFTISVYYSMSAEIKIAAESLEEAKLLVANMGLPTEAEYVSGSFEINEEVTAELNPPNPVLPR